MQHVVKSLKPINSSSFWNLICPRCFLIGWLCLVVGRRTVIPYQQVWEGCQVRALQATWSSAGSSLPDALLSRLSSSFTMREEVAWRGETLHRLFIPGFPINIADLNHQTETFNRVRRGLSPQNHVNQTSGSAIFPATCQTYWMKCQTSVDIFIEFIHCWSCLNWWVCSS